MKTETANVTCMRIFGMFGGGFALLIIFFVGHRAMGQLTGWTTLNIWFLLKGWIVYSFVKFLLFSLCRFKLTNIEYALLVCVAIVWLVALFFRQMLPSPVNELSLIFLVGAIFDPYPPYIFRFSA